MRRETAWRRLPPPGLPARRNRHIDSMTPTSRTSGHARLAPRASLVALLGLALAAPAVGAQLVTTPVAEHEGRAISSFGVMNNGLAPLTTVFEAFSFMVDTLGNVVYQPFDSANVRLKLSSSSVRLPPRATFNVSYEAAARTLPAWFVVTSTFSRPRVQGLNVKMQLPHVVYLLQKQPLARGDVVVHAFVYDSAAKRVRIKIENTSDRLGRMGRGTLRAGDAEEAVPPFPLFPHFWRWVEVRWPHDRAPERGELRFADFVLKLEHPVAVAPRVAAQSAASIASPPP